MMFRRPPFLVVDMSSYQGSQPNVDALLAHPHVVGVILKASEGLTEGSDIAGWFRSQWPRVRERAGGRYGNDLFRGAYHYLRCKGGTRASGAAQAKYFLDQVDAAGGWGPGDMHVLVDVEASGNAGVSAQEVIDTTEGFAAYVKQRHGGRVVLYARGLTRDLSITSKMGCDAVWNAGYTASMPMHGLEAWTRDDVVLWQYTDGTSYAVPMTLNLPMRIDGFGQVLDLSVYVDGARPPTLDSFKRRLVNNLLGVLVTVALLVVAALVAHHSIA